MRPHVGQQREGFHGMRALAQDSALSLLSGIRGQVVVLMRQSAECMAISTMPLRVGCVFYDEPREAAQTCGARRIVRVWPRQQLEKTSQPWGLGEVRCVAGLKQVVSSQ
jgi:hypothetical protein